MSANTPIHVPPPALVREFSGEQIMCLHPIVQPVVSDAQAVIRWQRSMLDRAVAAMEYSLARGGKNLLGTQQFTNLTASIAEITNQNVDDVRESWIAGSASMHREREVES